MDITDLDVVVPEPKRVKFGGTVYDLPADLPMEIFLRMNLAGTYKTEDGEDDQSKQLQSLISCLTDLFIWEMEDKGEAPEKVDEVRANVERTLKRRGTKFCFTLVREIYREDDQSADQAAAGADPTPPPAPQAAA